MVWSSIFGSRNSQGSKCGNTAKDAEAALRHMKEGNVLKEQDDHDGAVTSYKLALELMNREDMQCQEEMASCYSNIGNILRIKGDYNGALEATQKSIEIRRAQDSSTAATARAFALLAALHQLKGDQEAALLANEEALQVSRAVFGNENTETAQLHNNRGLMLRSKGDYDAALAQHQKALSIYLAKNDRISMGTAYNNLAKVFWRKGEHNRALEMLGSAQEMYMTAGLPSDHPFMANTLNNSALILACRGHPEMALSIHKKALAMQEGRLGKDHPQTSETLVDMGRAAYAMNNQEEARQYFERALQIQTEQMGSDHAKTKETQNWLSQCTTSSVTTEKAT